MRVSAPAPAIPTAATDAEVLAAHHRFPQPTVHVRVKTATAAVNVFFTEADFRKGANFAQVSITAGDVLSEAMELREVWLAGSGGTAAVELFAILKG
jgi:hypothetical protein